MHLHALQNSVDIRKILLYLLLCFLYAGTLAAGEVDTDESTYGDPANATSPRRFTTSFISLSPGHSIAVSQFMFGEGNKFEINIPGVDCRDPAGTYTRDGIIFKADFSATVLKQNKRYHYTFAAKGIAMFNTYIAGVMALDERIHETGQRQSVKFLFWGTSEMAGNTKDERPLFPF